MNKEDDARFVEIDCDNQEWLKSYLETSGIKYNKNKTLLFSSNEKDTESYELIANVKQIYQFISGLIQSKSVKVTCNKNGQLKDFEINGYKEKEVISILNHIQSMHISDKKTNNQINVENKHATH